MSDSISPADRLTPTRQVNGNAPLDHTHANAAQLLKLFSAPLDLPLHRGR